MKVLIKFSVLFILSVSLAVRSLGIPANTTSKDDLVYLFAGINDAASNTDSLMLVSYNSANNRAAFIQIPRDTFCHTDGKSMKLNSLYSSSLGRGMSQSESMKRLSDFVSESFGIKIDGYIGITTESLVNIVDAIGGVKLVLSDDLILKDPSGKILLRLASGENVLSGKDALILLRHRSSYATADIGRMDAQKLFIDGLIKTVRGGIRVEGILRFIRAADNGVITDITVREMIITVLKNLSLFKETAITYLTLPGEAIKDKLGVWYYVLNRESCSKITEKFLFSKTDSFDCNGVFTDTQNKDFNKIYTKHGFGWTEFDPGNVTGIDIPKRKECYIWKK